MICPKCGTVLSEDTIYCNKCGCNIKKHTNPKKRRIITIICVVIIIGILSSIGLVIYFSPSTQLKIALKNTDYSKVVSIYQANYRSNEFRETFEILIDSDLADMYSDCANGKYSCDIAINNLLVLQDVYNTGYLIDSIRQISASQQAYQDGSVAMQNEQYIDALKRLSEVIENDVQNYASAQSYIEQCYDKTYNQALQLIENGDYRTAYSLFIEINNYKDADTYVEQIDRYYDLYQQAQSAIKTSLVQAYSYVEQLPDNFLSNESIIETCKTCIPYCGDFRWEQGTKTVIQSDFFINNDTIYWYAGDGEDMWDNILSDNPQQIPTILYFSMLLGNPSPFFDRCPCAIDSNGEISATQAHYSEDDDTYNIKLGKDNIEIYYILKNETYTFVRTK